MTPVPVICTLTALTGNLQLARDSTHIGQVGGRSQKPLNRQVGHPFDVSISGRGFQTELSNTLLLLPSRLSSCPESRTLSA
jgi:hypothetical protein